MTTDPFSYDGPIARADGRRPYNHLSEEWAQRLINWALEIAKRPPQTLRALPVPRPKTGLPLLDFEAVPA